MAITFKLDGALLPFATVRMVTPQEPGGVAGLPAAAWYGEPLVANIQIEDTAGNLTSLEDGGWHPFTVDESACAKPRIFTGWILARSISRGPKQRVGASRVFDCEIIDQNALFSFRVFRASSAKRPAETDLARVTFALSSAPLSGLHTITSWANVTDNPVAFGDADYVTQYPAELFNSIAGTAGKNFYAFWDESIDATVIYYDQVGATNRDASIRFSNVIGDYDGSTTFAPLKDAVLERDPTDQYSGVLFGWRGGYVYQQTPFGDQRPDRDLVYRTDRVGRADTAASLTASQLAAHSAEKDVLRFSARLPASVVNLAHAGERVEVKFSHIPDLTSFTFVRIIRRNVVPTEGREDYYDVDFECSAPGVASPAGPGGGDPGVFPQIPCSGAPTIVQFTTADEPSDVIVTLDDPATAGNLLVLLMTHRTHAVAGDIDGWVLSPQDVTLIPDTGGADPGSVACYTRVAQGGETTVTSNWAGANGTRATLIELSGVNTMDTSGSGTTLGSLGGSSGSVTPSAVSQAFIVAVQGYNTGGEAGPPDRFITGGATELTYMEGTHPAHWVGYLIESPPSGTYAFALNAGSGSPGDNSTGGQIFVFSCAGDFPPAPGQPVNNSPVTPTPGGGNQEFTTAHPYADGSLRVLVDGIDQTQAVTESDPSAGTFTLDFDPRPDESIRTYFQGR